MLAYGGNGPAFAAIQAQDLGIGQVLVPRASPTFSALGTLVAHPAIDEERSCSARADALDLDRLRGLWADLAADAGVHFAEAGFSADTVQARWRVAMRYAGQNWALTFDLHEGRGLDDLGFVDDTLSARAIAAFNARHLAEYGHVRDGEVPEITGVRLSAQVETPMPPAGGGFTAPIVEPAPHGYRRANLGDGFADVAIHKGPDLIPGARVTGPAIIEEVFTTIAVYPGWQARVDDVGDYLLVRHP
jgi:N-methylhydantoinase A